MKSPNNSSPEEKGKQLMVFVKLLHEVTNIILDKQNYSAPRERFYYIIFMKLQFLLDAIHIQIFNLDNKPHYSLAAILSLRTCMLDVLNLYYVMDVHDDIEAATIRINIIMHDHLKFVYSDLKKEEKKEIRKDWPNLFDKTESLIKFTKLSSKDYVKEITHFDTLKEEAKEAIHIYEIFSKYEHNGAFTFNILHNPYSTDGNNKTKFMIYSAIGICALACKFIYSHWVADKSSLAIKLDDAIKHLLNFEGIK